MKTFIRQKAKEKGVSLRDICERLQLKSYPSFLRTIDNGENLKLSQLQTISEILDCTIDELVLGNANRNSESMILCPHCGKPIKFEKA